MNGSGEHVIDLRKLNSTSVSREEVASSLIAQLGGVLPTEPISSTLINSVFIGHHDTTLPLPPVAGVSGLLDHTSSFSSSSSTADRLITTIDIASSSAESVAKLADRVAGKHNKVSTVVRQSIGVSSAVVDTIKITGRGIAKVSSGQASVAGTVGFAIGSTAAAVGGLANASSLFASAVGIDIGQVASGATAIKSAAEVLELCVNQAGVAAKSAGINPKAVDSVVGTLVAVADVVEDAADDVIEVVDVIDSVTDAAGGLLDAVGQAAVRAGDEAGADASLVDVFGEITRSATDDSTELGQAVDNLEGAVDNVDDVVDEIFDDARRVEETLRESLHRVRQTVGASITIGHVTEVTTARRDNDDDDSSGDHVTSVGVVGGGFVAVASRRVRNWFECCRIS